MPVNVLFGIDSERPFGSDAFTENGKKERVENLDIISRINTLMNTFSASRTFFVLGDYLDQSVNNLGREYLAQVFQSDNKLVEIAQHTYSHPVIAHIKTRPDKIPISPQELLIELNKASKIITDTFLVKPIGLRTPLGYETGLDDRIEVLEKMKEAGIKYVSSNLRDMDGNLNPPLVVDGIVRQPYFYSNGILEIPSHGWQDTVFTGTSKTLGINNWPQSKDEIFNHYKSLLLEADVISKEQDRTISVAFCMHPWAIKKYDPELMILEKLLEFAKENGFNNLNYQTLIQQ